MGNQGEGEPTGEDYYNEWVSLFSIFGEHLKQKGKDALAQQIEDACKPLLDARSLKLREVVDYLRTNVSAAKKVGTGEYTDQEGGLIEAEGRNLLQQINTQVRDTHWES